MSYYINAPTLSSATAIYTNPEMTVCANDGYYVDGPIVRQLVDCVLLPAEECSLCGIECGFEFEGPVNQGVYYMSVDVGATVGPIEIKFNPMAAPNGIEVTFDSTVYNTVVSPTFGPLSAPAGLPTFIGIDTEDCGIVGTHTLNEYEYRSDLSMHALGTTEIVNVSAPQMQLSWADPDSCTMIIPKPLPTPTVMVIKVISPCERDSFYIRASCPNPLLVVSISASAGAPGELICGYPVGTVIYNSIPVNGDGTTLGLYDFMYYDALCTTPLVDNYYLSTACPAPYDWFRIENGIIVEFGECGSSFKYAAANCLGGPDIIVISSVLLSVGNIITLTNPAYSGCKFSIRGTSTSLPTEVVDTVSTTTTCADYCAYFQVYNLSPKPAVVSYRDCLGVLQSTTIPLHSFVFLCAKIGSITSTDSIRIEVESCECPE
jgi:hypothetical protein